MRRSLAILFGSAVCCLFSTMSYAANQLKVDPVQLAKKALNLNDCDEYEKGKRQKVCILCAHPAQIRWKGKMEKLESMYDLTFIDLCNSIGMGTANNVFSTEIKQMGYKVLGGYELCEDDSEKKLSMSEAEWKSSEKNIEDSLLIYKKGSTVVIKCDLASEIFQRYAEEHLKNRFDAIICDSGVDLDLPIFSSENTALLIASLKNGGVFLSPDYNDETLNKRFLYADHMHRVGQINPWISVVGDLDPYSSCEKNAQGYNCKSSISRNFSLPQNNAFIVSWGMDTKTITGCKIDDKLSNHLLGAIIENYSNQDPVSFPRIVIAKFDPNQSITETVPPDTDNWPDDNFDEKDSDYSDPEVIFPDSDLGVSYSISLDELQKDRPYHSDSVPLDEPQKENYYSDSVPLDEPQEENYYSDSVPLDEPQEESNDKNFG